MDCPCVGSKRFLKFRFKCKHISLWWAHAEKCEEQTHKRTRIAHDFHKEVWKFRICIYVQASRSSPSCDAFSPSQEQVLAVPSVSLFINTHTQTKSHSCTCSDSPLWLASTFATLPPFPFIQSILYSIAHLLATALLPLTGNVELYLKITTGKSIQKAHSVLQI